MDHDNEAGVAVESAVPGAGGEAPQMQVERSGPVDLVYDEFCARRDRGEAVDPDQFCAEFPALQSRLGHLLKFHLFLEDNPALLGPPSDICWPECGQTFLDFQLVLELGRGAFARVFLATEPKLGGRLVALKVAWHGGAEAEILGRLHHPNIVPIHSVTADPKSNLTAVCMPYLGSTTLRNVIDKLRGQPAAPTAADFFLESAGQLAHPLDPSAHPARPASILESGVYSDGVRAIAVQLADALAFLHERGIYHQDLKPSNVLMTPAGVPMLLDFNMCADARATALLGGTFPYMAPELLKGQAESSATLAADARSDIFSLGVILFELATGAHPFGPIPSSAGAAQIRGLLLERMRRGAPAVRSLNPGIEKSLGQLIERCLAWHADERPGSAGAIAMELRHELQPAARAKRFLGRHPRWAAAVVCLAALIGVTAVAVEAARPPLAKRQMDAGLELHRHGEFKQAVAQFSAILEANPQDAEAYRARGRAFQDLGAPDKQHYYASALADYHQADRLAPDGPTKARIGYCRNLTGSDPNLGVSSYLAAQMLGYESAGLCNNLGCCQLRTAKLAEAEASLDRAIELDKSMQAAYHNRALVHMQKAHDAESAKQGENFVRRVQAGVKDIDRAIELGPLSAELYFDAARLHGLAARIDPAQKKVALENLQEAIARNLNPGQLALEPSFSVLAGDAAFLKLQNSPRPAQAPSRAVRIVNPVKDAGR